MNNQYKGKVGVLQRVLPNYRIPFFDALADICDDGLSLFAGNSRKIEGIHEEKDLNIAQHWPAKNLHLFSGSAYMCLQFGWRKWLETIQPDILIVEGNPRNLNTFKVIDWMQTRNRKVLGWGLGAPPITSGFSTLRLSLRKRLLNSVDGMISYSYKGAQQYLDYGLKPESVFTAPNSVSPKPIGELPNRKRESDAKLSVIFLGRLQQRKRADLLIKACAFLPNELQPELLIVGDGPQNAELRRYAQKYYPNTQFFGNQEGEVLDALLKKADLFVLPGTGGLAIQQAMSSGLPVIVAEGDGTQSDLVRADNGWQIKSNDFSSLKMTLENALSDRNRLLEMGKKSFEITRDEINVETMAGKFVDALNQISNN